MAQKRWTRILEGEKVAPSPAPVLLEFPVLFLEDTGMQNQQRKGAVWRRCLAAEMLP